MENTNYQCNPSNDNDNPLGGDIAGTRPRRTPFTDLSQVDADLALARTLQEQERAYMMLRMRGDGGSDYGSWEAESFEHDDDFDDASEEDYDKSDVEVDNGEGHVFDEHAHAEGEDDDGQDVELDLSAFPDDAFARALQDAEQQDMAARLLALAGINESEDEDEVEDEYEDEDEDEDVGNLQWIDSEGKAALIVACMNPQLYNVAKTLIESGANVNVYRPGRHAGTPLHHAAKRGLDQTVKLLLSHGANALIMNDDCHTPLDVARAKGFGNVVRAIEGHLCLFTGWLRELYRPGFLEHHAPQLLSRKVWVVVLPCGSRNLARPFKLELAIYAGPQDPQPSTTIQLLKANLEEPNFNQPDPAAIISDISKSTRIKLAPASESEKHQLQIFCNACKGIPQVMHPSFPFDYQPPTAPPTAVASSTEDEELLAMAISASLQSFAHERPPNADTYLGSEAGASSSNHVEPYKEAAAAISHEASGSPTHVSEYDHDSPSFVHTAPYNPSSVPVPSANPAADADIDNGPIIYPSIDTSPVDLSSSNVAVVTGEANAKKADETTSSCTICLDAPLEGACVPCGHMAGCMTCLSEIKAKSWGCPVCRSRIDQIIRIYAV